MYRGQHDYWNCLHKFFSRVFQFEARLLLVRHFIPGTFTACPGTDFASLSLPGKGSHQGSILSWYLARGLQRLPQG